MYGRSKRKIVNLQGGKSHLKARGEEKKLLVLVLVKENHPPRFRQTKRV
jgi:hypothetical protein